VTSSSGDTGAPPTFRLRTFGTLRLVCSVDDTVLGGHGHQRRRLALLASARGREFLVCLLRAAVSPRRSRFLSRQAIRRVICQRLKDSIEPSAGLTKLKLRKLFLARLHWRSALKLSRGLYTPFLIKTSNAATHRGASNLHHGVCWCMICALKGAKSLATFHVVRCGNVRFCTTLHAWTTLFNHNGVQGVAGSNPAVPIRLT